MSVINDCRSALSSGQTEVYMPLPAIKTETLALRNRRNSWRLITVCNTTMAWDSDECWWAGVECRCMSACRGAAPTYLRNRYLLLAHIDLSERRSHGTDSSSARWVVKVFACIRACRDRLNYLYDSHLFCTAQERHHSGKRDTERKDETVFQSKQIWWSEPSPEGDSNQRHSVSPYLADLQTPLAH